MPHVALVSMTDFDVPSLLKLAKVMGLTEESTAIKSLPSTTHHVQKALLFLARLIGISVDKPREVINNLPPVLEQFVQLVFLISCDEDTAQSFTSRANMPCINYPFDDGSCILIMSASLGAWGGLIKTNLYQGIELSADEIEILCRLLVIINKPFPHMFLAYDRLKLTSSTFRITHK